jgi:membrane protease YdiL (CAAX protease family)
MEGTSNPRENVGRTADLIAIAVAIVFPSFATWLYFTYLGGQPASRAAYGVTKTLQFAFPAIWIFAVRRSARIHFVMPKWRDLAAGAAFGLTVVAAGLAAYYGFFRGGSTLGGAPRELTGKLSAFGIRTSFHFFALAAFYSCIHSLLEEYYWRWFVFGQLRRYIPLSLAIVISSLGFMAHHVLLVANFLHGYGPLTWLLSSAIAVGGAVWAWQYHRYGSLYAPWAGHFLIDAGLMWIGHDLWTAG